MKNSFFMFIYEPQFIADSVVNLMNTQLFDITEEIIYIYIT